MIIKNPALSDTKQLKRLWSEAFGDTDDFIELFFSRGFSSERSLCVYDNGAVTSALYWFDCYLGKERVAYIYGVATKKSYRKKGLSTALLKRTHEQLSGSGYSGAILVPAEERLFSFYGKLGYTECCFINSSEYPAAKVPIPLKKISTNEYFALRKKYLPQNSLEFDNNCLLFLDSIADFYKNESFILAKSKDSEKLKIIEFLGDKGYISSAIASLGFCVGALRSFGKSKPFAMYYPLKKNIKIYPQYLGFAFD